MREFSKGKADGSPFIISMGYCEFKAKHFSMKPENNQ
jgi:hypothetical protein